MTQTFKALSAEQTVRRLLCEEKVLVLFHARPDPDAVGSAFALRRILESCGIKAYCLCADEVPARLSFLCEGIQDDVSPESLPEEMEDAPAVCVDSAAPGQLGRLWDLFGPRIFLMIDHHGRGTPFADGLIDPDAASTTFVLGKVIDRLHKDGQIPFGTTCCPKDIAGLLYAGLSGDTGCFRFSNATGDTLKYAAKLCDTGIDTAEINRRLFEIKTDSQMLAEYTGYARMEKLFKGRVTLILFDLDTQKKLKLSGEDLETLVDVARAPQGVEVAVVAKETAARTWKVSCRSSNDFDVADFCAAFGGGGHRRAAGATFKETDKDALRSTLLETLKPFFN